MDLSLALKIWGSSGIGYGIQTLFLTEMWAERIFKEPLNAAGLQITRTFGVSLFGFGSRIFAIAMHGSPALKRLATQIGIAFSVAMQANIFARSAVYTPVALTETLIVFNGFIATLAYPLLFGEKEEK